MATSTQGSTLTFAGVPFQATNVSVQSPTLEVVDVTPPNAPLGTKWYAPTGDYTAPGRITVDAFAAFNPIGIQGTRDSLVFQTPLGNYTYYVMLEAIEFTARVGDLFQVRLTFTTTDYTS